MNEPRTYKSGPRYLAAFWSSALSPETQNQILRGIVLFLFGALVTHVWNRYRSRLKPIRWSAWYFKVAVAAADPQFGTTEVRHDGHPVANVHSAFVQVENESNSDLENVVVNMACLEGSRILRSMGAVQGSLQSIPFTTNFWNWLIDPEHRFAAYVSTHSDFQIPVLNRGGKANFSFLLCRDDALEPRLTVTCDHLGIEFKQRPSAIMLWGVPQIQAVCVGLAASFICVVALVVRVHSTWVTGVVAWVLGCLASILGVGVIKIWRWCVRQLS